MRRSNRRRVGYALSDRVRGDAARAPDAPVLGQGVAPSWLSRGWNSPRPRQGSEPDQGIQTSTTTTVSARRVRITTTGRVAVSTRCSRCASSGSGRRWATGPRTAGLDRAAGPADGRRTTTRSSLWCRAYAADRSSPRSPAAGCGRTESDLAGEVREQLVDEGHEAGCRDRASSSDRRITRHPERVVQPGEPIMLDIGDAGGFGWNQPDAVGSRQRRRPASRWCVHLLGAYSGAQAAGPGSHPVACEAVMPRTGMRRGGPRT